MVTTFKEPNKPQEHTCSHCRCTGYNMHKEVHYIGGQGVVEGWYCNDRLSCWQRWETKEKG